MKIQCNVCELAEANVLCCADEAALCWGCDGKVHAANKLASKHQRLSLSTSSSSHMPNCDICQETVGYFFCLEDRALLCRKCDVAIHTVNNHVSAHRRFLLTGVKVGLEPAEPKPSSSSGRSNSSEKAPEIDSRSLPRTNPPISSDDMGLNARSQVKLSSAGGSAAGSTPQWQLDEYLALSDLNQNYGYMDNNSPMADNEKFGESDGSPILRAAEKELDGDEFLGQVPDASWAVPQITSPPTASGLYWPKTYQNPSNFEVFVPDIGYSPLQNLHQNQFNGPSFKRQRHL